MSGGNSKNKARSKRQEGWEEAGGEFYQELYPGGEQELFENLQRADAAKLATLLPSKQARNTTAARARSQLERRQSTYARTTQSRDVTLSMLPDLSENLSNEERTWEEIMQIKAMPVPMNQKREIKARLQNATKLRLQGLERLQWRRRKAWLRLRARLAELLAKLEPWRGALREIEGRFGTGVVAYFLFLRWLLFLNLAIAALLGALLVLPGALLAEEERPCDDADDNSTACCAEAYLRRNASGEHPLASVLLGTGRLERTLLFYGAYGELLRAPAGPPYDLRLAYAAAPAAWALLSLAAILRTAAAGFRERLVESEGQFYKYCDLVFGGWDFCVRDDRSARTKRRALVDEIAGCLEDERLAEERRSRSRERRTLLHARRLAAHLLALAILAASGYLIYVAFRRSVRELGAGAAPADPTSLGRLRAALMEFLPFLAIVGLNLAVPELFGRLVAVESYRPAAAVRVTLLRTVLLRLASLGVLLSQLYLQVTDPARPRCASPDEPARLECWETHVGQQLYRLVLTDFALQLATTFLVSFPRALLARHARLACLKAAGAQDFYLPKHVLDVVYVQTVVWMGAFFCPLLPAVGAVFCLLIFYVKKFACLTCSAPSPVVYRASRSRALFMSVLLLGFAAAAAPVAYSIAELEPSWSCGPFRAGYGAVWRFVEQTFEGLPRALREALFALGTSTFAVPAFAALLLLLYYYWAVAAANRRMVEVLKNQLVLEGHDKQFLLDRLSAFIRQHQKRCERRPRADDDSAER